MGIRMVAHAIVKFGTDEQKDNFLPRILTGEVFFCQGYSETGGGFGSRGAVDGRPR